jgi:c-di-GMP-binding flagellar brake protein YcgR
MTQTQHTLFDNRRFDSRIPLEMYVSAYVLDQPQRTVTMDISESGLYLNALLQHPYPPRTPVGLEFELPALGETIWAAGETCRDSLDDYFYGLGVRFTQMANLHQRMLREYCWHARGGARGGPPVRKPAQRPGRSFKFWSTLRLP